MYLDASLVKIHQDNARKRSNADADTDGIRTQNNITLSVVGGGGGGILNFRQVSILAPTINLFTKILLTNFFLNSFNVGYTCIVFVV